MTSFLSVQSIKHFTHLHGPHVRVSTLRLLHHEFLHDPTKLYDINKLGSLRNESDRRCCNLLNSRVMASNQREISSIQGIIASDKTLLRQYHCVSTPYIASENVGIASGIINCPHCCAPLTVIAYLRLDRL